MKCKESYRENDRIDLERKRMKIKLYEIDI